MMKDVVISIHSVYGYDEPEPEIMDFSSDGYYFKDGITYCFSYLESDVTGLEGTRTSVFIRPGEVIIDRDGVISGRMTFREGERSTTLYETPYGNATMGINTESISFDFDDQGGSLDVEYFIDIEYNLVQKNKIHLEIKEQGGIR